MQIRDRIKEFRRVRASELKANPKNWRIHPENQKLALRGVLEEVGYADALIARELEDGTLELIDGHLRAETTPEHEVPVLILDVNEAEALKLLATLDPLAGMAETDAEILREILESVETENESTKELLLGMARENKLIVDELGDMPDVVAREYDESIADSVELIECPSCGHKFPK